MLGTRPFEIPHDGDESTRAARRTIDDDINDYQLKIQRLKTERNKLSSISILPSEVLSDIFIFVRDSISEIGFSSPNRLQWVRVGHVCHSWREVALNCPSLWTVPVFSKPLLAQEMIRRSKMAALTITSATNGWTPRMSEQLENATAQIFRVKSIQLTLAFYPGRWDAMLSSLSQPAPLLEDISLVCDPSSTFGEPLLFPNDALAIAPRLRSIDFRQLSFSWESAIFKHGSVTTLRLSNKTYGTVPGCISSITQMMDALSHLPNLQVLNFHDILPPHTTSNGSEKILELKFLKELTLDEKAVDCVFFLRHVRFPSCATVTLQCDSTKNKDSQIILSLVGQNLCSAQNVEAGTSRSPVIIQAVQLRASNPRTARIMFYDRIEHIEQHTYSNTFSPLVDIQFTGDDAGYNNHRHLTDINDTFDLSSLKALFISWIFDLDEIGVIRDSIGKLPALEFIQILESFPAICDAIGESPDDIPVKNLEGTKIRYPSLGKKTQHTPPPVINFPTLKSLSIRFVDFREHRYPENMESLVDMLINRSNMGAPIDGLTLNGCRGVFTSQRRQLGELVVDLEVDGLNINVEELDPLDWDEDDYSDESEDEETNSEYWGYENPYSYARGLYLPF